MDAACPVSWRLLFCGHAGWLMCAELPRRSPTPSRLLGAARVVCVLVLRVSSTCCYAAATAKRVPPFRAGTPGRGLPAAAYVRQLVPGTEEGRGLEGRRKGGGSWKGKVNFKTSFGKEGGSGAGKRRLEVSGEALRVAAGRAHTPLRARGNRGRCSRLERGPKSPGSGDRQCKRSGCVRAQPATGRAFSLPRGLRADLILSASSANPNQTSWISLDLLHPV